MDEHDSSRRGPLLERRRLLGALGGAAAVGTTGAMAGCLSSLPMLGQQIRYEDVDVPDRNDSDYREWVPSGTDAELEAVPSGFVSVHRPTAIESADVFAGVAYDRAVGPVVSQLDYLGVGYENYDVLIDQESLVVGRGSFDARVVREAVLDSGYEAVDGIDDFAVFRRTDTDRTVAVRDGTVLFGLSADSLEIVEAAIETATRRNGPLHETDDGFETISRKTGAPPAAFLSSTVDGLGNGLIEEYDHRWSAHFTTYDDEYLYEVMYSIISSAADVSEQRLRRHLENDDRALEAYSVDVGVDGTMLSIAIQLSHDEVRSLVDDPEPRTPPQITWEISTENGETARIEHLAGDSVDASELQLTLDGVGPNAETPSRQFVDSFETVEPGDAITVDVDDRSAVDDIAIVYEPTDSRSLVLAAHRPE